MKKIFAAACLSLIIHSVPCYAANVPPPIAAVSAVLQLSDDQVHVLVATIVARDTAIQPLVTELQQHGQAIDQLLQKPDADPAAIGKLLLEARALEGKINDARRQAAAQFEQALTPDQAERLQHIREAAAVCEVIPAFRATGLL